MKQHIFEREYSSDFMRWISIYGEIKDDEAKIEELQDTIVKDNDPALAYYFAANIGTKNYRMQNVILKSKSAKYGILFAQNIKNADINILQNMILESGQIKYICNLGCFVPGVDLKRIEAILLKMNDAKYAHKFIKHVKGASYHKFKKMIIKSRKPRYLFELAKRLKSKRDINLIQDLIIKSKSPTYIRMFAEKIKNSDVEKLEEAILELDTESVKKFALYVKKSKMRNFIIMI